MPGHRPSKKGVNALMTRASVFFANEMDCRIKSGNDERYHFNLQTAKHHQPVFGSGSGAPVFFLPRRQTRGSGAPTGASVNSRRACEPACIAGLMRSGVDIPAKDAAPSGAPLAAILGLGTVLPGAGQGAPSPLIGRLSPPLS